MKLKIAFAGASGTGKTTLMNELIKQTQDVIKFDVCNVGSREVIKELGLENPYEVDLQGRRKEFQHLLFEKKKEWEDAHETFITDRTHIDNLVYSIMHDCVNTVDESFMRKCFEQTQKYDIIILCKMDRFFHLGNDPLRVKSESYHRVYEEILISLLRSVWEDSCVSACSDPSFVFMIPESKEIDFKSELWYKLRIPSTKEICELTKEICK